MDSREAAWDGRRAFFSFFSFMPGVIIQYNLEGTVRSQWFVCLSSTPKWRNRTCCQEEIKWLDSMIFKMFSQPKQFYNSRKGTYISILWLSAGSEIQGENCKQIYMMHKNI